MLGVQQIDVLQRLQIGDLQIRQLLHGIAVDAGHVVGGQLLLREALSLVRHEFDVASDLLRASAHRRPEAHDLRAGRQSVEHRDRP